MLTVRQIEAKRTYPFLKEIHYAKSIPSISYAYGLFEIGELIGVVTYGTPPSPTMREGICGKENSSFVLELNRLCLLYNRKNEASFLVAKSLKLLPRPKIIISMADTNQNHIGYVYQATNFNYYGLSAKRTNWKVKGKEHLHGMTIADEFRGIPNRAKLMREKYGDDFKLIDRPRKHRYVYFIGTKREIKNFKKAFRYKMKDYPK